MHVKNTTGDARFLPALEGWVAEDEVVEVPAEVGESLVDAQGWTAAKAPKATTTEAHVADPQED